MKLHILSDLPRFEKDCENDFFNPGLIVDTNELGNEYIRDILALRNLEEQISTTVKGLKFYDIGKLPQHLQDQFLKDRVPLTIASVPEATLPSKFGNMLVKYTIFARQEPRSWC